MKWEMEMEEVEVALEKIWDLHDKVSDAIHTISRTHFLRSIKGLGRRKHQAASEGGAGGGGGGKAKAGGFVFVKDFRGATEEEDDGGGAIAEARSLNAIRTALENLEDQLEFFHTIQSQQQAERDAAIARLEQSRIILAMRLADHHGKKYKVIDEALAFVGDVPDPGRFITPDKLFVNARSSSSENLEERDGKQPNALMQLLVSGMALAKRSLRLENFGGLLGNAALFAVSMIAVFQLHHVAVKDDFYLETTTAPEQTSWTAESCSSQRPEKITQHNKMKQLDVLLARG